MSLFTTITSSRWAPTISKLKKNDNSSNKKNGLNYTRHTINPVLPGGGGGGGAHCASADFNEL